MIEITNLIGSKLLSDSETYLMDLGTAELRIQGGNEPPSNLVDGPLYSRYFDSAPSPVPQPIQPTRPAQTSC